MIVIQEEGEDTSARCTADNCDGRPVARLQKEPPEYNPTIYLCREHAEVIGRFLIQRAGLECAAPKPEAKP